MVEVGRKIYTEQEGISTTTTTTTYLCHVQRQFKSGRLIRKRSWQLEPKIILQKLRQVFPQPNRTDYNGVWQIYAYPVNFVSFNTG